MERVSRNRDEDAYIQVGKRAAECMLGIIQGRLSRPVAGLLDWGCGPGRVAAHILADHPEIPYRGCDIDAEAIAWANENLGPFFDATSPHVPLPYGDCTFDAVIACSVMTHLFRRQQRLWLGELGRIIRPGGVFVATVHGAAAARDLGVDHIPGIEDKYLDDALNGVAPPGYYRTVLQTEAYTRNAWTWGGFEVAGYDEAALENHDVVTLVR